MRGGNDGTLRAVMETAKRARWWELGGGRKKGSAG